MFGAAELGKVLLHIIALCAIALVVVRLMGNRTVGQLSPFDFVIMVGIGDIIVSASMDKTQTIIAGIEGLLALLVLQQVLSYLSLKNNTLRKWVEGTPVTLIQDGKIIKEHFAKTHFNYDDLRQELHRQGMDMTNVKDIKMARLESCGVFSVVKVQEREPLTKGDFEAFFKSIQDNPLSPLGKQWTKMEQLIDDLHYITETMKQQQLQNAQNNVQSTKDLH